MRKDVGHKLKNYKVGELKFRDFRNYYKVSHQDTVVVA